MSFRKKSLNLLQEKEAQLAELAAQSECKVKVFYSTIDELAELNDRIEEKVSEIDTYLQRLSETKHGLKNAQSKNEKIMKNFEQLLCVE